MNEERSGHSGHDNGPTIEGSATTRYQPPLRAMAHLSGGATIASLCSATHIRATGSATAKQAHRQASHYRGPVTCVAMARALAGGGEDLDGGLCLHPSSGQ
jgi:hypothetical protein